MTWEKGRQLKSFDSNTYTYNANGIRTSKTVAGVKHDYLLDGTKILCEGWNYDETSKTYQDILIPLYDNEDSVCGIIYNGEPYYFQKNLQGDIVAITNKSGKVIGRYSYDAWGVPTIVKDDSACSITTINPFRYRGYYFDKEIGMYYLQSRYYDPQLARFINADNLQILGILVLVNHITLGNLFSYCGNAPVADKDIAGAISEHDLSALLDPLSVFEKFVTSLYQDLKNGLLLVGAYATKILSPIAVKALWWKPIVAIALVALAVALVVIAVTAVYNAKKAKKKGKTPIPSQLKNGSKVKTPTSHKGEFSDKKRGKYTHKKTKWKFEKSKDGHYNGEHWHAYPENAQTGDYYNISPDGRVLS